MKKQVIAFMMSMMIAVASLGSAPAFAAETGSENAGSSETKEAFEIATDDMSRVDEEAIEEEAEIPEVAPIIEKAQSEAHNDAKSAAKGSVDGGSKVTWTTNTMPAAFDTTSISARKRVYLTAVQDGYMRVAYNGDSIVIEYYD